MYSFKVGDLVGIRHPQEPATIIKTGIIVDTTKYNVIVQWVSYSRSFFMEKEDEIFEELNKTYLLSRQSYHRLNVKAALFLLSPS